MSSLTRQPKPGPGPPARMLHGGGHAARVRPWPGEPSIAQLLTLDLSNPPPVAVLRSWLGEIRRDGYTRVRTGAVSSLRTAPFDALKFEVVQRLTLLHLDLLAPVPRLDPVARVSFRKGRAIDHARLAELDRAAFPAGWALDETSVAEAAGATARSRVRIVEADNGILLGYAISGRSGRAAFLQRLAVHPTSQGRGVGAALVTDAIAWAKRWRCHTVAVNTQDTNDTARQLYERAGFVTRSHCLFVMERSLDVPA